MGESSIEFVVMNSENIRIEMFCLGIKFNCRVDSGWPSFSLLC